MEERPKGRTQTKRDTLAFRDGVGREANNLTPEKTALFRNLIEAKSLLSFCSDGGEGKD